MNNFFLQMYINALTRPDLVALTQTHQVPFSDQEIDYLFPLLKTRWREFFLNPDPLIDQISVETSEDCADRVIALINSLMR